MRYFVRLDWRTAGGEPRSKIVKVRAENEYLAREKAEDELISKFANVWHLSSTARGTVS